MMPASNKKTSKKKTQWSAVIRRPNFILPKRDVSASKQDADIKHGASKVKNSPTIPSKTKVSPFSVGTKSIDACNIQEIPHSVVVINKTSSKQETKTKKEGSVATVDHASTVTAKAVSLPSNLHHDVHSPFAGVQSTFGSEHAVCRGKEHPSESESEFIVSENDVLSLGRSFRLATTLQERTNHVLDRKASESRSRQRVHHEGDLLPFSEKSITANGTANTKAMANTKVKVKSDKLVIAKNHPQDRPGTHPTPPFPTFYHNGKKVTMIDADLMIFVIDMVPPELCDVILGCTSRHVSYMTAIGKTEKCWRSLYTYTKMDIPCAEVPGLADIMQRIMSGVVHIVGRVFEKPKEASRLRPRSWKEPHLLMYQKVRGKTPHTGVEMHYDGCHLTATIMLSNSIEYQGGGTYFRALRKTIKLRKGQVLVHPGDLYHKGVDISKGTRKMIVCFMDGFQPDIHDNSFECDDRKEYEENIIKT